jgi:16S rRNA (guanine527-N7)-methyltransferase
MQINSFIDSLKELNIELDEEKLNKLEIYYNFLNEYNKHTNLTTITEKEDVYLKHFYDSLTISKVVDLNNINNLLDIGTGAGFPGIVLKIVYPNIKLTVLDSNNKKTTFIKLLLEKLNINDVTIINDRAENYAINHLNEFDIVTSRAVAFMDIIISLSFPFIKKEGKVILMKGNLDNEISILNNHQKELDINKYSINNFKLPISGDERNIVVLEKNNLSTKVLNYNQILKRNKIWNKTT